jgi:hypothetical protein
MHYIPATSYLCVYDCNIFARLISSMHKQKWSVNRFLSRRANKAQQTEKRKEEASPTESMLLLVYSFRSGAPFDADCL